ncbi:unnamed protein product, partial [Ectocarpus fasciculatus]
GRTPGPWRRRLARRKRRWPRLRARFRLLRRPWAEPSPPLKRRRRRESRPQARPEPCAPCWRRRPLGVPFTVPASVGVSATSGRSEPTTTWRCLRVRVRWTTSWSRARRGLPLAWSTSGSTGSAGCRSSSWRSWGIWRMPWDSGSRLPADAPGCSTCWRCPSQGSGLRSTWPSETRLSPRT